MRWRFRAARCGRAVKRISRNDYAAAVVVGRCYGIGAGRDRHFSAGAAHHAVCAAGRGLLGQSFAALSPPAACASLFRADGAKLGSAPRGAEEGQISGFFDDDVFLPAAAVALSRAVVDSGGVGGFLLERGGVDVAVARCLSLYSLRSGIESKTCLLRWKCAQNA